MTVVVEAAQMNVLKGELRLTVLHANGIDKNPRTVGTKSIEAIVQRIRRDVQNAIVVPAHGNNLRELLEEAALRQPLVAALSRILQTALHDVDRSRPDLRIDRYRLDIAVEMPTHNEIDAALFGKRDNVAVVEHIRIGMVHHEDAPLRCLRRCTHQIGLHPCERLLYALPVFYIQRAACILRIHLKESPRSAVDHDNMRNAVVHGKAVPIRRSIQRLCLRLCKQRLKERTIIVIAPRVEHGGRSEHRRNPLEPILLVLFMLIPRSEGNITAMQDKVWAFLLCHRSKRLMRTKNLRIRDG